MTNYLAEIQRPDCFGFAMNYLPNPEATELLKYIEALEARTALAQPEPEGPTDEQWDAIKDRLWNNYETVGHQGERFMYQGDFDDALDVARQDLSRWGRPTIKPVPAAERLPEAEDCFSGQHGQRSYKCWAQQYHTDNDGQPLRTVLEAWDLVDYRLLARCRRWYYAWLPHHALPVPGAEVG
jgi:hypothetical protein